MDKRTSSQTRKELLKAVRQRYRRSSKMDKARTLDEFIALTGYHRKHGVCLLNQTCNTESQAAREPCVRSRRIYDEAVKEALTVLWEASDRICGKRLKVILPELLDAMELHGHLSLVPELKRRVLRVSAATIDRLLKPIGGGAQSRRRSRRAKKAGKEIPGSHIRGLGSTRSWLPGNGYGFPLWDVYGRILHPHTRCDGRVLRVDGIRSVAGQRAIPCC